MQLAIDTSTETASIALSESGEIVSEFTWHSGQNHTVELMPNLVHLLRQAKVELHSVDGIIVAKGPGSFNGLRAGMGTAKGLAFSLGIPIVGIGTLEVEAFPHALTTLPICPVFDAGRGEVAAAIFQQKGDRWLRLVDEHITTVGELCPRIEGRAIFCGRITAHIAQQIEELMGERAVILQAASKLRRAGFLAELGWKRLAREDFDDLFALQPLYLRKPPVGD